ncbi:phosphotransferase family protein [Nocardioides campestrisoli]|uniref:phosphotransferase family protein n=1 Tax=Nocardioides campestrisoli TaxID=2736757 RepID=UPI00163D4644|nr:phosphotransferase family protein [Nocardioides campestrisoli]
MSTLTSAPTAGEMAGRLRTWATAHVPGAAEVTDVGPMPGNAGLSFGCDVLDAGGSVLTSLVVRLAPPGVRRQGNTDVLRQVPLLRTLQAGGIPVAPLLWSTDDPRWFGTDAIVQERLRAKHLPMHDPTSGALPADGDTTPYLRQAVSALAELHALDWRAGLSDWDEIQSVADQVAFWRRFLPRHPDPAWTELGERLADRLLEADPGGHRTGLFHGDYQTHNILYDEADGRLVAVIDWEIAGLGPVGLDVGWLAMMVDPACWHEERSAVALVREEPDRIRRWYEEDSGQPLEHFDYYQALACYRYGAITGFNLYLHRSGRRVDESNELTGPAAPALFRAGLRLLS